MRTKDVRCARRRSSGITVVIILLAGSLATAQTTAPRPLPVPERGFVSAQPAATWEEGLICGNGTIGANVLSRPLDETIIFTHERLFLPMGDPVEPPLLAPRLFEIRRLIDRGLYTQATKLAFELSEQNGFMYPDPFVPAFDLSVVTKAEGEVRDYARSVDFHTGVATVHWADDRGAFERRLFVSRADGVAVLSLTAPPGALDCRLELRPRQLSEKLDAKLIERSNRVFESKVADIQVAATGPELTWRNSFPEAYPGSIQALEGLVMVATYEGAVITEGSTLQAVRTDRALVVVDLGVVYDPEHSRLDAMRERFAALPADFDALLARHVERHAALFDRMRLDLGGGDDHARTTEELIASSKREDPNRALIEKEFDAARYNIISCTGELPPVLQGVWGGTYSPGWASDFTHNGNVPSAIASMLMGNMPELMLAYTSYMEEIAPYLEMNAERIFGARGIVLPSRSSTHGFNNAFAPTFAGAFWVGGAAWAAHFFYDYWLYTGDREFLAEHALPFMEKAVVFFEDYLYEGPDGKLVFSPCQSPENWPSNSKSQGSFNATMSIAACRELLRNTIAASRELGVNWERIPAWQAMLEKLPDYLISPEGVVQEWTTPKLTDNLKHRHTSQLYALYDGLPEEIAADPELRAAFTKIIEIKLDTHWKESSGFMSFGLVQLGQAAASLGEGELAYRCVQHLVDRYWLSNLASMHNHRSLFNMDISGGMPAVIIKMLVASEPGRITLLPALPTAWPTGTIEGVLCRGQVEVERLHWSEERIVARFRSAVDQVVEVDMPFEMKGVSLREGGETYVNLEYTGDVTLSLSAGKPVTLVTKR